MDWMQRLRIDLLGRPGCHLCDEARDVLEELAKEFPIQVRKVDISKDLELLRRFRDHIPVGLVKDRELFRHHARPDRLRPILAGWVEKEGLD